MKELEEPSTLLGGGLSSSSEDEAWKCNMQIFSQKVKQRREKMRMQAKMQIDLGKKESYQCYKHAC